MTLPLLMLGPGGSYNTQYDVKGNSLVKSRTTRSQGHDPDGESAGGLAAWGQLPGREEDVDSDVDGGRRKRSKGQRADSFEHHDPAATPTYAKPGKDSAHQKLALLMAITHWMQVQSQSLFELDDLQADLEQTIYEAIHEALHEAQQPQPTVRLIRWNGGTLDLPTPAPVFADRDDPADPLDPQTLADATHRLKLSTTRKPHHDDPEPHTQADENPHDDPRVAAEPWLFTDHAGTGRRLGNLQSHRLRTRRSTHQKGRTDPRCQQGALFGIVA